MVREAPRANGLSRKTSVQREFRKTFKGRNLSHSEFVAGAGQLVENDLRQLEQKKRADFSKFEFKDDDDNARPVERINLGELKRLAAEQSMMERKLDLVVAKLDLAASETAAADGNFAAREDTRGVEANAGETGNNKREPDEGPMLQFANYIECAKMENMSFDAETKAAIELMDLMNNKGGSTSLYHAIFDWHMKHLKTQSAVSADTLHMTLLKRHNIG